MKKKNPVQQGIESAVNKAKAVVSSVFKIEDKTNITTLSKRELEDELAKKTMRKK